jgi:CopG-like RHH_1 or ribbon-helix-helix domain, RHH_5
MAKKQTRRSVSLSKDVYNLLKAKCDKEGVTMSGVVSQLIEEYLSGSVKPSTKEREDAPETKRSSASGSRYVVNTDLIISGPSNESEAEQIVNTLVQRLVKKGDIAEALILSADPE